MKAFIASVIAALAIAGIAAVTLDALGMSSAARSAGASTRLGSH